MRIIFACGGTAGHINPALAVAGRIKELMPDSEFLFIGAVGQMESDLVPRAGYKIETVRVRGLSRERDARRLFPQHKRGVASCPLHHKGKEDHKTL